MRLRLILLFFGTGLHISISAQFNFNIKRTFNETSHQIFNASYSSGGTFIVTTGSDNNIIIWNAGSGIIYRTLAGLKKRPNVACFSEENQLIVSGGEDNIITLWDPLTSNIHSTFEGHLGPVKALDISPDGKYIASGSADQTVRIWDVKNRNLVFELKGHKKDVNAVRFSPDGKTLASGGADKMLIVWNTDNGNIIKSKEAHAGWIRDVAFSPDGTLIASCGDDNLIRIFDVPGLNITRTLPGHKDWVQSIDFSSDGKYLISGGHDQYIILWDVMSGKILSQSEKQGQIVLSVDISPLRSDFISATLLSENLEIWALSGLNESLLSELTKKASDGLATVFEKTDSRERTNEVFEEITIPEPNKVKPANSVIEIFAPVPSQGRIDYDRNNLYLIGRVTDPEGINAFLINKNPVKLSDAGVFEFKLNLTRGENPVSLIAINNKGKMNEMQVIVDCTAEEVIARDPEMPDIYKGKYYALLIGINDYQSSEIPDLDNPVKDAESLCNVLATQYTFEKENIIFLKNPVQSEIIITLDELARKLTKNDNLLIFYAGHGHWDDKGKVGYWFPSDASKNSTVNWFRNSTLRDFIGSIETKHTLLIADACFSGAIFKTRAAFTDAPQGIEKLYELPSRKAMTSGILQEVPDESVFIKYMVKRLGENEEKFLTSELLFSSFKTAVMNNSSNVPQYGVIQNVGDEGGDFIFLKR